MSARPLPVDPTTALPDGLVWRGQRLGGAGTRTQATGFATLDAELPGGGWPLGALVEILLAGQGQGELTLLLPLLRATPADRWHAWIAPPHLPYAPALAAAGVACERLLRVQPASPAQALWAARTSARSGACASVLAWLPEADASGLRRLQLAAEEGGLPLFLFRPPGVARQASPAALRLQLSRAGETLCVRILKRRGPLLATPLLLASADAQPPSPPSPTQQARPPCPPALSVPAAPSTASSQPCPRSTPAPQPSDAPTYTFTPTPTVPHALVRPPAPRPRPAGVLPG